MATAEEIFAREFKQTISALPKNYAIEKIPSILEDPEIPLGRKFVIHGIEDKIFEPLNGQEVIELGRIRPEVNVLDSTGKKKTDVEGLPIAVKQRTPDGAMFIRSGKKVNIPFKFSSSDSDYNYANAWKDAPDKKPFVYAVPKKHLFRLNLTALVISSRKVKCYNGYTFKTWHYGQVTIAVIPFNPTAKYTNTKVLKVGTGTNYDNEIKKYVDGLIKLGIIPNVPDYNVDDGITNLVMGIALPDYDDYEEESILALSEEKSLTYEMATELLVE